MIFIILSSREFTINNIINELKRKTFLIKNEFSKVVQFAVSAIFIEDVINIYDLNLKFK